MPPHPRAQSAAAALPRCRRAGYTLAHAGRQLRARPDRLLGGGRHAGDHGGLDHHHRNLFRIPRRRADRPDRAPGRDAIRLRGSHRRPAPADRPHVEPPAPQPGAIRAEARPDHAPAVGAGKPRQRHPGDAGRHRHRLDPADRTRADAFGAEPAGAGQRQVIEPAAAGAHRRARHSVAGALAPPAGVARSRRGAAGGVADLDARRATRPRRSASAASSPTSGSTARASARATMPASAARWCRRGCRPMPDRSSSTSTASASPAPRSTG